MSTTNPIAHPERGTREQIGWIDEAIAETQKPVAEPPKFNRDPWLPAFGAMSAAMAMRFPEIVRVIGGHP